MLAIMNNIIYFEVYKLVGSPEFSISFISLHIVAHTRYYLLIQIIRFSSHHISTFKMTSSLPQIILTTGSNRGIGFSITQVLGLRSPQNIYILACRSVTSGHEAVKELQKLSVKAQLDVVELDILNDSTIINAAKYVESKYGRLDGTSPPHTLAYSKLETNK